MCEKQQGYRPLAGTPFFVHITGIFTEMIVKISRIVLLLFFLTIQCSFNSTMQMKRYLGGTMGTSYAIKVVESADFFTKNPGLHDEIKELLSKINQQMSTYIKNSELSRFNHSGKNKWIDVSKDLALVMHVASQVSKKSDGAFDVTVGPLVNLWGFGPAFTKNDIPADSQIAAKMLHIGYRNVHVRLSPPSLKKDIDSLKCDLSAIAKGYGADKVAELLDEKGVDNYLIEIGGEISAKGVNQNGQKWRIGVSTPDARAEVQGIITVNNACIATSGDYQNFFEKNGVRYSHTIDPRTGRPVRHKLVSVTVIHSSCMLADAWATAINVLGSEDGFNLAQQEKLTVFMVVKSKDGFYEKMTTSFTKYLQKN